MAAIISVTSSHHHPFSSKFSPLPLNSSPLLKFPHHIKLHPHHTNFSNLSSTSFSFFGNKTPRHHFTPIFNKIEPDPEVEVQTTGVKVALSMLNFYKREISPILPKSCRYVPSCSEYSMIAYKKYGVAKGTILTAWRLCRCNPLGGSGFDPPRWFGEERASEPEE